MLNTLIKNNLEAARANLAAAKANLETALAVQAAIGKAENANLHNLDELRKIITRGRLLQGVVTPSATIGTFSRAWRRLLNDLRTDEADQRHIAAAEALKALKITWIDRPQNNKRDFCYLG